MQERRPSGVSSVTAVEPVTEKKQKTEAEVYLKGADSESGSLKTIETKKLSWQQCAALLFGEYVVIAILSFANSYSVLGMAGGLIATVITGLVTLWTSHILWRYCMKHPEHVDICRIGYELFGRNRWAYEATMVGFVLNNLFIMGLHVLSGAIAINTLSDHATCTIVWTVIFLLVMFCLSLFRELKILAMLSMIAASTMLVALILCMAFAGAEDHPAGWQPGDAITIRAFAPSNVGFVAGLNAILNVVYTFVGQVLVPTYVQDMREPADFPKALYTVTIAEIVLFCLGGSIVYAYVGEEFVTAPAYGSLERKYAKVVAAWTIPTILVVGILYGVITSRVLFYRVFGQDSVHVHRVTKRGTLVWVSIVASVWIVAWVIGEAIPFFSDLLSLLSSLFDSFFGFLFWLSTSYASCGDMLIYEQGVAFFRLYSKEDIRRSAWLKIESVFSALMIVVGLFILGAGSYTSAKAIANSYAEGTVAGAFSCENNGF